MSLPVGPPAKRRKRNTALVEGSVEAARAVTHENVTTITRSGAMKTKSVLVPLVPRVKQGATTSRDASHQADSSHFEDNNDNPIREDHVPPRANKVEYV